MVKRHYPRNVKEVLTRHLTRLTYSNSNQISSSMVLGTLKEGKKKFSKGKDLYETSSTLQNAMESLETTKFLWCLRKLKSTSLVYPLLPAAQ